ncbi:hypothetical protein BDR03DRAFT_1093042 [Suillus americanus]|nr:hypothetical protein BDR03DRAFT_1093042 [Suillus americanus]
MPLLAGIFAKRDRQSSARNATPNLNVPTTPTSTASISSGTAVSSEPDYVFPDKSLKSLPAAAYAGQAAAASSSKLKLPFRRRHAHQPHVTGTSTNVFSLNDSPPRAHISGVVSESGHDLPPPPPKPSFFGLHHDPSINSSINSTLSLPNENTRHQPRLDTPSVVARSEIHSAPPSSATIPPNLKKSGGLFSWTRERTKSKPAPPPATIAAPPAPSPSPRENFNLKAFRHVRSESPTSLADVPSVELPLPPVRPRPRGDSVASDSSQKISVAAFREAQARRSRANSPVPSFRPPSSIDTLRVENMSRQRASTVSTPPGSEHHLSFNRNSTAPPLSILINRTSSALDTSTSGSDESEESDEEVDSDGVPIKPSRKRTVTRRPGPRSQSDAGHALTASSAQVQRPEPPRWSKSDNVQLRQPDNMAAMRARASASTSALTPNAAARRASTLAAVNASAASSGKYTKKSSSSPLSPRAAKDDDSNTSSDSDNDSEDMPLSALVAPRRPGSSASISTNRSAASRPRMPAKPLIDIKSLVGSPPMLTPVLRHEHSVKKPSTKGKEREMDRDEPFAPPPVISLTPSRTAESPAQETPRSPAGPTPKIPSPTRHKKSSSDVGSIPRPSSSPIEVDDDLRDAIRLVTSFDQSRDSSQSPTQPSQQMPSRNTAPPPAVERLSSADDKPESPRDDRIVPTPVREYKPPASFSVTSRPPRRYTTDLSQAVSPALPTATFSAVSKRSPSPQRSSSPTKSSFAPRSRAGILAQQSNVPSTDKSDVSSVVSTSRSSRSSRVPPVPLITAVPDSPSVKASWGSSKDLYKTRPPSTPSVLDGRMSRPPSGPLVSVVPSSRPGMPAVPPSSRSQTQSLMPSRPFASNSSLRGQSPAGSSTGDSSSGRGAPFTPHDGSDIGVSTGLRDGSDADSTLRARGVNAKRSSVSFGNDPPRGRERMKNDADDEEKRNERRRNEAKSAIEFGKIVNGRGPIVHNGSDEDLVPQHGQQMSINPMMGMDGMMPGMNAPAWGAWQQSMPTGMGPMIASQFSPDQSYFVAHQRAMMIAKQAYQMAVAQHAMALAGDEWERGSNIGGGSVYGGGGGSVYSGMGGGGGGMGMLGVPGMSMPGMMPNQWSTGPVMFPGRIGSTQSEFGGGSRSVYGESFGPSMSSRSSHAPSGYGVPNSPASSYGGGSRPRAKTGASQPSNLQPPMPGRNPGRKAAPPSSWKSAR